MVLEAYPSSEGPIFNHKSRCYGLGQTFRFRGMGLHLDGLLLRRKSLKLNFQERKQGGNLNRSGATVSVTYKFVPQNRSKGHNEHERNTMLFGGVSFLPFFPPQLGSLRDQLLVQVWYGLMSVLYFVYRSQEESIFTPTAFTLRWNDLVNRQRKRSAWGKLKGEKKPAQQIMIP